MISLPTKVKKGLITEDEIWEKGRMKQIEEKLLVVKTEKTITGFLPEDIREIKEEITRLTEELNRRIIAMFKQKGEVKQASLHSTIDSNHKQYDERNEHLDRELKEMSDRFDHLKMLEQRFQDVIDYSIVYKEQKQRRRLCFNILKDYAHWNKDTRRVATLSRRE